MLKSVIITTCVLRMFVYRYYFKVSCYAPRYLSLVCAVVFPFLEDLIHVYSCVGTRYSTLSQEQTLTTRFVQFSPIPQVVQVSTGMETSTDSHCNVLPTFSENKTLTMSFCNSLSCPHTSKRTGIVS